MDLKVFVEGAGELLIEEGAKLKDVAKKAFGSNYKRYLGAKIRNEVYNLNKQVDNHMYIKFLDITDIDGYRIYY